MTTAETKTTALEVVDPNGELLDVREASTERLALLVADLDDHRARLADVDAIVSDELVGRLDRAASWTMRVGDPTGDRQFEISAPSPSAGTEAYDASLLEGELRALVGRETIAESAAATALERTLTIVVRVPLDADLEELAKKVRTAPDVELAGVAVDVVKADVGRKPVLGGIAKLRKVSGTGAALDRAQLPKSPPSRRAKVKVKTR